MQAQKFRAANFEDAMDEVRKTLGHDALIVERKQLYGARGLRSGTPTVEITAISADDATRGGLGVDHVSLPELLQRRLVRGGVPERAAGCLAMRVRSELGRLGGGRRNQVRALTAAIALEMLFAPPVGRGARVAAIVGPTGVGKTTTLAKLAARAALLERKKVGLLCVDQYRIGGVEQLQRYAELIGVPMVVAHDGRSLVRALRRVSDADLVLIDTSGRSPRDVTAIAELGACLAYAGEKVEIYLCLPVAMRAQEIAMVVAQQSKLEPTRLIATKADEAVCCSGIPAAQARSGLPMAYVTTGQRVPEDIEVATPELVADLLSGMEQESS